MDILKYQHISFRLPSLLMRDIEEFAGLLETNKSDVIRMALQDTINRYLGPKKRQNKTKPINPVRNLTP